MRSRNWGRRILVFTLCGVGFVALCLLALRLAGYFVVVNRDGGRVDGARELHFGEAGAAEPLPTAEFSERPRNVILMIADGMGPAHVAAARAQVAGPSGRLFFERMPVLGSITTHGRSRMVPDSGASATSIASGWKTDNGMLGWLPDGARPRSVAEAALERGMAVGLVTTSYLLDATSAAFVVHVEDRGDLPGVARQMARSGASVLLGGMPEDGSEEDERRMLEIFREAGWATARTWAELRGLTGAPRVAGLFPPDDIPRAEEEPSLRELAGVALDRLATDPDGFFLMVETEETDTASHKHDLERMVAGLAELDAVAAAAVDFARESGDTLVIVTADHETGGLTLISGKEQTRLGVRWATTSHTGVPVPLYAYGAGAERFGGVRDNTEIGRTLADLLELDLGQPEPPATDAPEASGP